MLAFEFACFQPSENRALVHTQLCCSAFDRVGTIFPLSRVVLISVQLHCRDLPLRTQVTDDLAGNRVNEPWGLISLPLQRRSNLSIHQPSGIELAHALLKGLRPSKHGVTAYPPLIPELFLGSRLPIDLDPDLAVSALAIHDDLSNHQAQQLFALLIGGRGRLEDVWVSRCPGPQWPRGPPA
jgi:hypothetical protein